MLSPLIPMSIASSARGKRPTREGDTSPIVASPSSGDGGAGLYRHRSHSAQNLLSPGLGGSDEEDREEDLLGLHPIWQSGVGPITPGPSFLSPPLPSASSPDQPPKDLERKASVVTSTPRLHRPRSMYELHITPPAYHAVYNRPGLGTAQIVYPREEEGIEGLPDYTCSVHIETYMPRKVEFTAPSTQAKDRAWKKQYVVLHGTSIKVFKYDLRTHPIVGEEDWSGGAGMGAGADGNAPVHFHMGEYGVPESAQGSSSLFPTSMGIVKAKARSRLPSGSNGLNVLLRHYSLQNAESGLAADYVKRKHVVRVRAEGEQFLLQAKDDR
jgi:primosomal replication protein N